MKTKKRQIYYRQFEARRERLAQVVLILGFVWFLGLLGVAIGSDHFTALNWLKNVTIWGSLTVDRLLAIGGWLAVAIGVAGWWIVRNMLRPAQLFVVLRDFQSRAATELATKYVRRHGAKWGYWLTLENADLKAKDSIGGEAEVVPADRDGNDPTLPIGSWVVVSFGLSLVGTTVLLLRYLNSAPLEWARRLAGDLGAIGDLLFPVFVIVVYGALVLVVAAIIRWLLLTVQRALVSPARINSAESCARVLDTIVARVRHRATTLTLGPMPVIAVDDAWWKATVERSVDEASLVTFFLAGRTSEALKWEIDLVRKKMDPDRVLFIKLDAENIQLSDGTGRTQISAALADPEGHIEEAVRKILFGPSGEPVGQGP